MVKKYSDFILEKFGLAEHDGVLFIVDVQKEFGNFIPQNFVKNLFKYCAEFKQVYQIWDCNNATAETFTFPNQQKAIKKKYGKSFLPEDVVKRLDNLTSEKKEGDIVILEGVDAQFVRVNNKHEWFMVSGELIDLFNKIKPMNAIAVGGADHECLLDFLVASRAFGVNVALNHKHIYSAEDKQT